MDSLGPELSLELFPTATWAGRSPSGPPAADYPGLRPTGSWQLDPRGELHGLDPAGEGWQNRETGEFVDLSGRRLVLAYGSNPDPNKLLNRTEFFGNQSVIALRAAVFGWAAAWCDARRQRDGSVVATLVPLPGRVEVHPVLALTSHQIDAMDQWEGHPDHYRRTAHEGVVVLESGRPADGVEVYLGTPQHRPALMTAGRYLLCADMPHAEVDGMVGAPRA